MPSGAQFFNSHGSVSIDQTFKNLTFHKKGAVSMIGGGPVFGNSLVVTNCVSPIIAFRATSGPVWFYASSVVGTTWYFSVFSSVPDDVDWYHFDQPPTTSASTFGLQTFNLAGEIVFDSSFKYLKIVDAFEDTDLPAFAYAQESQMNSFYLPDDYFMALSYGPYPKTRSYPSGRVYAIVQMTPCTVLHQYTAGNDETRDFRFKLGAYFSGTNVIIEPAYLGHFDPYGGNPWDDYNALIVDVTGL